MSIPLPARSNSDSCFFVLHCRLPDKSCCMLLAAALRTRSGELASTYEAELSHMKQHSQHQYIAVNLIFKLAVRLCCTRSTTLALLPLPKNHGQGGNARNLSDLITHQGQCQHYSSVPTLFEGVVKTRPERQNSHEYSPPPDSPRTTFRSRISCVLRPNPCWSDGPTVSSPLSNCFLRSDWTHNKNDSYGIRCTAVFPL